MENEIVVVNITNYTIYDYLKSGETNDELKARAEDTRQKSIDTWTELLKEHPDNKQCERYLNNVKNSKYEVMTYAEFAKRQRTFLVDREPEEITKDEYNEMFNVLPPFIECNRGAIHLFCMSEMYTGTYTSQYAKYGNKYYKKIVDYRDESTWIHNYLKGE